MPLLQKIYDLIDDIQFVDNTWQEAQEEKSRLKKEIREQVQKIVIARKNMAIANQQKIKNENREAYYNGLIDGYTDIINGLDEYE
jgi:peptidoglycan hydrolase CwlO-like protein